VTRKVDVVQDFHGTRVPDPYRWLEDGESDEVRAWTDAENARTRAFVDAVPFAPRIAARLKELLSIGFCASPAARTTASGVRRYFHQRRVGGQNQPILYVRDGLRGEDRVLLDPSTLSSDGTTAVDWWYPSFDGELLAWGKSESGSEESTLHVREVASGKDRELAIAHTQHASVAWLRDGSGFYYSRYPAPGTVPEGDEKYFAKIFLHRLGADPAHDPLIFGEARDKTDIPSVTLSPNGRWLVARVHMGWDRSEIFAKDVTREGSSWIPVVVGEHALFDPIPRDDRLYLLTNLGAMRYRLVAIPWEKAGDRGSWRDVIPEGEDVLEGAAIISRTIVATYLHDAATRLERLTIDGAPIGPIALPSLGSASATGEWNGDEAFVNFTSFVAPFEVDRVDLASGALEPWDRVTANVRLPEVKVSMLFATSKDGTRVPMFVVERPGTPRDGDNPTLLYGYGGFNVNQTPAFSSRALTTVEQGGVWVQAVLRGGGEFGEDWHRGGMLEKKQNVFDDFIACAEELVRRKITRPERLAMVGGSNGGLLVAACATQRPELFRAGLALVPLTDMLRYHRFRIGKLWIPEYGCADEAADFPFLHAYSPYHRVEDGARYPAMLFATAESDSRVDPMHARKMAARMREAQGDPERPILLRVESKAGHGQGKPISKVAEALADEQSFAFSQVGTKP
jgi:prolyl oligopeptidase